MIPFDFILYDDIDFVLDSHNHFDFELENNIFDYTLYSFSTVDFVLDESTSIGEYVLISKRYPGNPSDVTSYCCDIILTEDDCDILTEDGIKLTYE